MSCLICTTTSLPPLPRLPGSQVAPTTDAGSPASRQLQTFAVTPVPGGGSTHTNPSPRRVYHKRRTLRRFLNHLIGQATAVCIHSAGSSAETPLPPDLPRGPRPINLLKPLMALTALPCLEQNGRDLNGLYRRVVLRVHPILQRWRKVRERMGAILGARTDSNKSDQGFAALQGSGCAFKEFCLQAWVSFVILLSIQVPGADAVLQVLTKEIGCRQTLVLSHADVDSARS